MIVTIRSAGIRVSGWRAWLAAALVFTASTLVMGLAAILLIGVAVTISALFAIVVSVAIGLAGIASLRRSMRQH
jgi:hypothetical protein